MSGGGGRHLLGQVSIINDLLEHVDEVVKLSVDVAHDDHWLLHPQHVGLLLYRLQ